MPTQICAQENPKKLESEAQSSSETKENKEKLRVSFKKNQLKIQKSINEVCVSCSNNPNLKEERGENDEN